MKAIIKYTAEFTIQKNLPHAAGEAAEADEIFMDRIEVRPEGLTLLSSCGKTIFPHWRETTGGYVVPAGTEATYDGAWRALNTIRGIDFPQSEITSVKSTLGNFSTLEEYEAFRGPERIYRTFS